jgi:hypothetical protein
MNHPSSISCRPSERLVLGGERATEEREGATERASMPYPDQIGSSLLLLELALIRHGQTEAVQNSLHVTQDQAQPLCAAPFLPTITSRFSRPRCLQPHHAPSRTEAWRRERQCYHFVLSWPISYPASS